MLSEGSISKNLQSCSFLKSASKYAIKYSKMLAGLVALSLFLYFLYYNFYGKRKDYPPGPVPLPLFGNLLQIDRDAPEKTMIKLGKRFGSVFTFWIGSDPNVVITDYEVLKEALIKQGDIFAGRPKNWLFENLLEGRYGIIFIDGNSWRDHRRFSLQVLRDFGFGKNIMEVKVQAEIDKLFAHIQSLIGDNQSEIIDMEMPLQLCVGNVISSVVLGHTFEVGDTNLEELKQIIDEQFRLLQDPGLQLVQSYPWMRFLPIPGRNYSQARDNRVRYVQWLTKELDVHKQDFDWNAEPTNYVGAYLKELQRRKDNDEMVEPFSERQMLEVVSDLWVAGMETTVTTLRWGLLYMVHYPTVQEKVHNEIQMVLQDREPRMAERNRLLYTAATIQEMQRLANILPFNLQHTTLQDTVLNGHHIKKGTTILPQISAVMMDSNYFPNPDRFDPTRYLDPDGKSLKRVDQLVPFSMGKRQCLGESLARMELFLIFTSLIQKFQFLPEHEGELPSLVGNFGITRTPKKHRMKVLRR